MSADVAGLLPVAEAQARLLALAPPLPPRDVPLLLAVGHRAARDVAALRTQPAADLSAMDGYAIRFADLPGPWTVIGESAAGRGFGGAIAAGEAVRIFTGAPLPPGADSVLIQEEAARDGDRLALMGEGRPRRGVNVRPAASDFAHGLRLIAAGTRIGPAQVALAAAGGHATLPVRLPRVALLSTGDELRAVGAALPPGALPASNAPMLAALIGARAEVRDLGIVPDRLEALTAAIAGAAAEADILVTIGGASVGDHDLVRPALLAAGARIDVRRVAMKPGKPLMAGRLGDAVTLGLPGNPVSAYVTGLVFLLPLIAHLAGEADPLPRPGRHPLAAPLPATETRATYLRARIVAGEVVPLGGQDSAGLVALAAADALIVRPAHAPPAAAGEMVTTILL